MDNHGFNIPCEHLIACQEQREQKVKVRRRKMWRPENWINPYKVSPTFRPLTTIETLELAVEAGADAILKALRTGATRVNNMDDPPQGRGVIVFIPDEEEQNGEH